MIRHLFAYLNRRDASGRLADLREEERWLRIDLQRIQAAIRIVEGQEAQAKARLHAAEMAR